MKPLNSAATYDRAPTERQEANKNAIIRREQKNTSGPAEECDFFLKKNNNIYLKDYYKK